MLFNSLHFLLFFPSVTALYFLVPPSRRWALLLAASCYFYMAFIPAYILILFLLIGIDYLAARIIDRSEGARRKVALGVSLAANVALLGTFKYFDFFSDTVAAVARALGGAATAPHLGLVLPIGLSFHTFQSMAYTIEVYRRRQPVERDLGIYALYVLFYPQMVAGPIERPQNLLHQFREPHSFDDGRVARGLSLMLWGFFKKVVIADRLAVMVNAVYSAPTAFSRLQLLAATYFFAFQIYCDFSGYSDIALGAAEVMGFRLSRNFARPYYADSIQEFWRRWHISLSTWFRDYVYLPLGGSKNGAARTIVNVLVVFVLSGLWHGASWTFVVWGALHGAFLATSIATRAVRGRVVHGLGLERFPRAWRVARIVLTFHAVVLAWIFFRADSLRDAFAILRILAFGAPSRVGTTAVDDVSAIVDFASSLVLVAVLFGFHALEQRGTRDDLTKLPVPLRWGVYYATLMAVLFLGRWEAQTFIYFQF